MSRYSPLHQVVVFSLLLLVCFSGGVLTWADGRLIPTGLSIPLALAAYILNEQLGWISIKTVGANILGIVAFMVAGFEFFGGEVESKLLAGVHLLCYIQWILLFQRKSAEQYWWNIALSILQIVSSAVLTNSGWFGLLILAYVAVLAWTIAVYIMLLSDQQFRRSEGLDLDVAEEDFSPETVMTPQGVWRESQSLARRGLRDYQSIRSSVTNSIRLNSRKSWITGAFVRGMVGLTAAVFLLGLFIFLAVPRFWDQGGGIFQDLATARAPAKRTLSGFTEEIKLGDVGAILDNSRLVFRVKLSNVQGSRRISVLDYARSLGMEEPLFRGAVLTTYDHGTWKPPPDNYGQYVAAPSPDFRRDRGARRENNSSPRPTGRSGDFMRSSVRQEYRLEPIGTRTLFTIGPSPIRGAYNRGRDFRFDLHSETLELRVDEDVAAGELPYQVLTRSEYLRDFIFPSNFQGLLDHQRRGNFSPFLELPRTQLPQLTRMAEQLRSNVPRTSSNDPEGVNFPERVAQRIRAHLADSGEFAYATNVPIRDGTIDPVEDFVVNRKAGHCEYFASTMALMLRAVGIPSRIVNGFKGGIESKEDQSFEVQQRFAHSWVEAYVGRRWQTFDPTPASERTESLAVAQPSLAFRLRALSMEYWSAYVTNLTWERQLELVEPYLLALQQGWRGLSIETLLDTVLGWFYLILENPLRLFSWGGGLSLIVVACAIWLGKRLVRMARRWTSWREAQGGPERRQLGANLQFFSRFLGLMAGRGVRPQLADTPLEFAVTSLEQVGLNTPERKSFATRLSEAFYQVRFGQHPLSETQSVELDHALSQLDLDLKRPVVP